MSHYVKQFSEKKIVNQGRLNLASNASTNIDGKGNVHFMGTDGNNDQSVNLQDTLLVRDLRTNLISDIFTKTGAIVKDIDRSIKIVADRISYLFYAHEKDRVIVYFDTRGQNGRLAHCIFTRAVSESPVWPYVSNHIFLYKFMRTRVGSPFTDIENAP